MSKKLDTTQFGLVYDENTKTFVKLDDKKAQESAPIEEDSLEVSDKAHAEAQSESFEYEEKTLDEMEAEYKQKMGQEESGKTDLQQEREKKRVLVDQSLTEYEKHRAQARQERMNVNIRDIEKASEDQVKHMQQLRADYIGRAQKVLSAGDIEQQQRLTKSYQQQQDAAMHQADSASNLVSMSINDALMNGGKDDAYAEDHVGEQYGIFHQESYGKKKTIVINGAPVTLDKDVAESIQEKRSPIFKSSKVLQEDVKGDSVDEIEESAEDAMNEAKSEELSADEMKSVQKTVDERADAEKVKLKKERDKVKREDVDNTDDYTLEAGFDGESENGHSNNTVEDSTQKGRKAVTMGVITGAAIIGAQNSYEKSRFAELERSLERDREDISKSWIVPRAKDMERETEIEYQRQQELEMEAKKERELPKVAWDNVIQPDEYNGRKLPYIDYGDTEPQYQMSM